MKEYHVQELRGNPLFYKKYHGGKNFMKKLLSLTMALILLLSFTACSGGNETVNENGGESGEIATTITEPVEVEFWHAMSGGHEEALTKITNDFNEQHENITVKLVNQGSYGDLGQKVMASAKADTLPVMSQAYEDWITEYIQYDFVTNLTPYINHPEVGWTEDELNDIVKVFREANQWDGKYYGIPFNKSTRILFYNTGLLEERNVEVPTTWDELRAAAEKLTFEENGKKVIGMGFENAIGLEFSTYVKQAGGDFIDEKTGEVLFNSPEGKEALTFINDMIQDGVARLAGEDGYMSGPFGRGDVAMYIGSSAGIPYVAGSAEGNIEWSATVLPKGKEAATNFAGTNVTVFNTATEQQKLAAWKYMKFLINTKNTAYWAEKSGYLPVRYSALESESWKAYVKENPVYGVGQQQFDAGFYDPRVIGAYGMKNAVAKEIEAVLLGQKTVEQGLNDAAEAAQKELDRANR